MKCRDVLSCLNFRFFFLAHGHAEEEISISSIGFDTVFVIFFCSRIFRFPQTAILYLIMCQIIVTSLAFHSPVSMFYVNYLYIHLSTFVFPFWVCSCAFLTMDLWFLSCQSPLNFKLPIEKE